jgi:hypothetical protein
MKFGSSWLAVPLHRNLPPLTEQWRTASIPRLLPRSASETMSTSCPSTTVEQRQSEETPAILFL